MIKEVPVDRIVEVPVEKMIYNEVEVPVERVVTKEVFVEVERQVPVDRIVEVRGREKETATRKVQVLMRPQCQRYASALAQHASKDPDILYEDSPLCAVMHSRSALTPSLLPGARGKGG